MFLPHTFRAFLLLLAVALLGGCSTSGPQRYAVSGTVNYKGQPLKTGVITFIPQGAESPAGGASVTDGTYAIPKAAGLLEGNYRVSISVPAGAEAPVNDEEGPGVGAERGETKETLPARYNTDTELRAEVKAGTPNEFNFDLK